MLIQERRQLLLDALHRAMKLEVQYIDTFSLIVVDGYFCPKDVEHMVCHPLETLLIGEQANDDPVAQIAGIMGQSREWVQGFIDRFEKDYADPGGPVPRADRTRSSMVLETNNDYVRGYHEGGNAEIKRFLRS